MPKLFIPKRVRVGFVKREDTFDGKLAYVIYYDAAGKLRKQDSWDGWRDDKIEPIEFDNVPTAGFMLNRGIKRYNWSHFGSDRIMIRIADPRGAEFEIDPRNLVGLLMHTDCSKRQITDELVYAWAGKELVLLPCSSDEYKAACNYTRLQSSKVSVKSLKPGAIYMTRNEQTVMYLGHYMYYKQQYNSKSREVKKAITERGRSTYDIIINNPRVGSKQHMFCYLDNKFNDNNAWFPVKSVAATIADVVSEHCDDRFSILLQAFRDHQDHWAVVGYEKRELPEDFWRFKKKKYDFYNEHVAFTEYCGNIYKVYLKRHHDHTFESHPDMCYVCAAEMLDESGGHSCIDSSKCRNRIGFDIGFKMPSVSDDKYSSGRYYSREPYLNKIDMSNFFDLDFVFGNGMKKPVVDRSCVDG